MTSPTLNKRLTSLEAVLPQASIHYGPAEKEAAAHRYADSLKAPAPLNSARDTYFGTRSLKGLAADYEAMLRGAPTPWL